MASAYLRKTVPATELLLLAEIANAGADLDVPVESGLCTTAGRGQLAAEMASIWPAARVACHFLDLYRAERCERWLHTRGAAATVHCTPDLPEGEFDVVAFPLSAEGDGEWTRELLQSGFARLRLGGRMWVSTNNPRDTWLAECLRRFFKKIKRIPARSGVVYQGMKAQPLRKVKDFSCEFAFRDQGSLVRVFSRPGVFGHRQLDLGARALMEACEVQPGQRVLDLGCGTGVVSLAVASRHPDVQILALDANPRAIECTLRGAQLNGFTQIQARLNADADAGEVSAFDVALANPPYYSHFRIGQIFLRGAADALRQGGLLFLVTKQPEVYDRLCRDAGFRQVTVTPVRTYFVLKAVR